MSECKHVWDERNYEHDLYGCAKCDRELSIDEVIVMLNEHGALKRENENLKASIRRLAEIDALLGDDDATRR